MYFLCLCRIIIISIFVRELVCRDRPCLKTNCPSGTIFKLSSSKDSAAVRCGMFLPRCVVALVGRLSVKSINQIGSCLFMVVLKK